MIEHNAEPNSCSSCSFPIFNIVKEQQKPLLSGKVGIA